MVAVSSTSCASVNFSRNLANSASGTSTGVCVIASAYSRTSLSVSEKSPLLAYSGKASIFSREIPFCLLTAEPMSIQNGHPISVATRKEASSLSVSSTLWLKSSDCSICP
jgi:hypothetical protein